MPPSKMRSILSWTKRHVQQELVNYASVEAYSELEPPLRAKESFRAEVLKITRVDQNTVIVFFEVFGNRSVRTLTRYKDYFLNLAHDYLLEYAELVGVSKISYQKWKPKPGFDVVNPVKVTIFSDRDLNKDRKIYYLTLHFD